MPRADKAMFIQNMLSELEHQQNGSAPSTPEPDSKEWWREVAQELGVKAQQAEATTRRLTHENGELHKALAAYEEQVLGFEETTRRLREALETAHQYFTDNADNNLTDEYVIARIDAALAPTPPTADPEGQS